MMKKRGLLLAVCACLLTIQGLSQEIANSDKLSPNLSFVEGKNNMSRQYMVYLKPGDMGFLAKRLPGIPYKVAGNGYYTCILISCTAADIMKLLSAPEVVFVESADRIAKEELRINTLDISTNRINVVHNEFPNLGGNGTHISIKENLPDSNDIDIRGRFIQTPVQSTSVNLHATTMATMAAGGGNTWHLGKGAAWAANISSASFTNLLPEPASYYATYNVTVQNHSYGVGIENFYGADAATYDANALSFPSLVQVYSSGNSGNITPATGKYAGIAGFANLTGSFKMAKNILVVGATDSFNIVATASSKGPAHDGRIKPDLVAYGEDGSSGSAALTSGTIALMQQRYKQQFGQLPASELMRAIIINAAKDIGNMGPDYSNGFGALDAYTAIKQIQPGRFGTGSIQQGQTVTTPITIPAGITRLQVTLCWNDQPATPNAPVALVNDLDMQLEQSSNGAITYPWILNSYPQIDSLRKPAIHGRDSLNTVEQVTLLNPPAGTYNIVVRGNRVSNAQPFAWSYLIDSASAFHWDFPTSTDHIFPATSQVIRWTSSYTSTGILEYSTDGGFSWILADPAVNPATGYYRLSIPDLTGSMIIRMRFGADTYLSNEVIVARRTNTAVGFNCTDSFSFNWRRTPNATAYRLYEMGSSYLQPFNLTTDSTVVLYKSQHPSLYYAVAPIINGKEAVRSYTFDYTLQGVGCYVRALSGFADNNNALLELSLGSTLGVTSVVFQRLGNNGYEDIYTAAAPFGLLINYTDQSTRDGENVYRARITLGNGQVIYSNTISLFMLREQNYLVFPNPVTRGSHVQVLSKNVQGDIFQLFNTLGAKLYQGTLEDRLSSFPIPTLPAGIYIIRIISGSRQSFTGKLLIQ